MKGKKIFVSEKGFTTTDIIISVIIIVLFISIITTSFYNYYISIQAKDRKTMAINIIIDVIENVEIMNYDNINQDSINSLVDNLKNNGTIPNNYNINTILQNYNEIEGNEGKQDLIKILTVTINYSIGNKTENIEISRLIKNKQ